MTGNDSKIVCFSARPEQQGLRLDVVLSALLKSDMSRSGVQALIKNGQVEIAGRKVKPGLRLVGDEKIRVRIPVREPLQVTAEVRPLNIVFEDDHLIVLDKPAKMVVHPAPGHVRGTLANALLAHCGDCLLNLGGALRPGIVHRLDKDTSGLMVVAKSKEAYEGLAEALRAKKVQRIYNCLVHGFVSPNKITVKAPIGRHPKARLKMAVVPGGRFARTYFTVLRHLKDYTLLEARLDTGRTHQIRVHATFMGHPIVGDLLYGRRQDNLSLKRQFLHSVKLGFIHPVTKENLQFESELPIDLSAFLKIAEN